MRAEWIPARVRDRRDATDRIAVVDLEYASGDPVGEYPAGAHIDVRVGPDDIVRQYSLCGPDSEPAFYRIAVLRAQPSRGGSTAMHALEVGDMVDISVPRQNFGLVAASRHILIAGGIGITPLIAMARALDGSGGDYRLHYVARGRDAAVFAPELEDHPRVSLHYTSGNASRRPSPEVMLGHPDSTAAVYVCGSNDFMTQVLAGAAHLGWPDKALHTERFSAVPTEKSQESEFTVQLASSGDSYIVPANRSILDVLRMNRVPVDFSCEQGICGACVVSVLTGEPDHRDDVLTEEERAEGAVTLCVSRSHGKLLELDL